MASTHESMNIEEELLLVIPVLEIIDIIVEYELDEMDEFEPDWEDISSFLTF